MNLTINYKVKSRLIEEFLKRDGIEELKDSSFFSKIGFSKKEYADIYFHSGSVDKKSIEEIKNAKKIVVNSKTTKNEILKHIDNTENKIEVIYPAIDIEYKKPKEIKKEFCKKFDIDIKKKLILFTAQNIKANGIIDFINIIMQLNSQNYMAVVAADKKQIYNLKFNISKLNLENKLILFEDYENIDELFLASDIFLLPTYNKNFASNVLKAMYCKCAVFTTSSNSASELLDTFATMDSPQDRSIVFKVDALLQNKDDLKLIKEQNRNIAKNYTLNNQLSRLNRLFF